MAETTSRDIDVGLMRIGGSGDSLVSQLFAEKTAPNAYDVHLIVQKWDGSIVDQQMDFDPATTLHFKSHGMMNELDVTKLVSDNVISGADHSASYYSFDDYSKAVVLDYNKAMRGVASVYNDIMDEIDPGGKNTMRASEIDGVHDVNNLHWEFTDNFLKAAIESAENISEMNDGDLNPLIEQATIARQELANAGANALGAAEAFFSYVKPPGPGIEVEQGVDLDKYQIGGADTIDKIIENKI